MVLLYCFNTLRFTVCHRYEREFETIKLLEGGWDNVDLMYNSHIIIQKKNN
jgi:hypothetical protein